MTKQRPVLIAGNWKMNHGTSETESFFKKFAELTSSLSDAERATLKRGLVHLSIFPPYLSLAKALDYSKNFGFQIIVGSQNTSWEPKGAYTGEISAGMLNELGIHASLVGHSERRQYFGETDDTVRKRTEQLLDQGMNQIIICVGETRTEREDGDTEKVLSRQIEAVLVKAESKISTQLGQKCLLAYEPVWAIGTGLTATPTQAEDAHHFIRRTVEKIAGTQKARETQVLYGGSVTPENIDALIQCPNVDGALVGGASLKAESFFLLLKSALKAQT